MDWIPPQVIDCIFETVEMEKELLRLMMHHDINIQDEIKRRQTAERTRTLSMGLTGIDWS